MAEWRRVRLAELAADIPAAFATGPFGSDVSARNFQLSGVPMIRGGNLSTDVGVRLNESDFVFLSKESLSRFSRSLARPGDLVFTCWGTVGQIGFIGDASEFEEYIVSNKQMKMTPDADQVLGLFLYYCLSQPFMLAYVSGQSIGSSIPGFNLGQLKELTILLPPLDEQCAIVEVLGALDDKIVANRDSIAKMEELAGAQFGKLACHDGSALSSLARFVNGKAFTKGATGSGRVVVRIAELNSGMGGSTVYNNIEVADDHLARPGDLLFAWSGSLTAARWYRPEAIVNQQIFKVIPNDGVPLWLVNQAVHAKLDEFRAIAADKATTMGHIQRRHLDEPVSIPSPDDVRRIDGLMTGLWEAALAAEKESLKLAEVRDELLPLLMSGKVRVRDAERVASDVL